MTPNKKKPPFLKSPEKKEKKIGKTENFANQEIHPKIIKNELNIK